MFSNKSRTASRSKPKIRQIQVPTTVTPPPTPKKATPAKTTPKKVTPSKRAADDHDTPKPKRVKGGKAGAKRSDPRHINVEPGKRAFVEIIERTGEPEFRGSDENLMLCIGRVATMNEGQTAIEWREKVFTITDEKVWVKQVVRGKKITAKYVLVGEDGTVADCPTRSYIAFYPHGCINNRGEAQSEDKRVRLGRAYNLALQQQRAGERLSFIDGYDEDAYTAELKDFKVDVVKEKATPKTPTSTRGKGQTPATSMAVASQPQAKQAAKEVVEDGPKKDGMKVSFARHVFRPD
jgi:hypothetical protein